MKIILHILFIVFIFNAFCSCNIISALTMSREEKTTVAEWKNDKYSVNIQRRQGWSGPHYYYCKVKVKKLGELFYKKLISISFSRELYCTCIIRHPLDKDTLIIDFCNKLIKKNN
jgi:hypothetical protein